MRKERNRLSEVIIFSFFSSLQLQIQVPVLLAGSALWSIWQMSVLLILFMGRKGCFTDRGVKTLSSLCELVSPLFESWGRLGLWRVLWVVSKKIHFTLENEVSHSSFKPYTETHVNKAYDLGFKKPWVNISAVCQCYTGNQNLLSHIRKLNYW